MFSHSLQSVPFVRPGADTLLRVEGWPKVERVLQMIDAIEAVGIDPAEVSPEHCMRCFQATALRDWGA